MGDLITQKILTKKGRATENILGQKKCLHVGCGDRKIKGAVGVDSLDLPAVDVVHDLDQTPWPFEDNSFDIIYAHSVVEHLDNIVSFMEECWRLLKKDGRLVIVVPYFRSTDAFSDPTHKKFFTSQTLDYFIQKPDSKLSVYRYSDKLFTQKRFWYGWPHPSNNPLVQLFKKMIHKYSKQYDQYFSLLLPMKIVVWELEVIKK